MKRWDFILSKRSKPENIDKVICKSDGATAYCNALSPNGCCMCKNTVCNNAVCVILKDTYFESHLYLED